MIAAKMYELADVLNLPKGVILLNVYHKVDYKLPTELMVPLLNLSTSDMFLQKNTNMVSLKPIINGCRNS